tara:strand:- start:764 stop:1582 length:819 start_codon:yes stop_codon:yes gene_type:complete
MAPRNFPKGGKGRTLSRSGIQRIMDASDSSVPGGSFSDLARADRQIQVKYDRPGDVQGFVDRSRKFQEGIDAGGRLDDSGVLQLTGTDVKDAQGRTLLSMSTPTMTAQAPTLSQLAGDAKRFLTGFNTLSFDPEARTSQNPEGSVISRQPGILGLISKVAPSPVSFIPGASAISKGLDIFRNIFFPPPPKVTYGSKVTGTVTEEPLDSGVFSGLNIELKDKPEPPPVENFQSILDPTMNPALYGDGTFFNRFDEQLDQLGIDRDVLENQTSV